MLFYYSDQILDCRWQEESSRDRINREPGMRAIMTRDSDRFIPLRERVLIARRQKADMFVSIHADAALNRSAWGASV